VLLQPAGGYLQLQLVVESHKSVALQKGCPQRLCKPVPNLSKFFSSPFLPLLFLPPFFSLLLFWSLVPLSLSQP